MISVPNTVYSTYNQPVTEVRTITSSYCAGVPTLPVGGGGGGGGGGSGGVCTYVPVGTGVGNLGVSGPFTTSYGLGVIVSFPFSFLLFERFLGEVGYGADDR